MFERRRCTSIGICRVLERLDDRIPEEGGEALGLPSEIIIPLQDPALCLDKYSRSMMTARSPYQIQLRMTRSFKRDKHVRVTLIKDIDDMDDIDHMDLAEPDKFVIQSNEYKIRVYLIAQDSSSLAHSVVAPTNEFMLKYLEISLPSDFAQIAETSKDVAKLRDVLNELLVFRSCVMCGAGFFQNNEKVDFCEACELSIDNEGLDVTECPICYGDMMSYSAWTLRCCRKNAHKACIAKCGRQCPFCRSSETKPTLGRTR